MNESKASNGLLYDSDDSTAPRIHELKTWPEFYRFILSGEKRFELRKDDRGFRVGDLLHLREWDRQDGYTGRSVDVRVTYLMSGFGLRRDWVVMSIELES